MIQDLVRNNPNLRNLNTWYRGWASGKSIGHLNFHEMRQTAAGMIVDPGSGDVGLPNVVSIPLDDDHLTICKPARRDALVYLRTKAFVELHLADPLPKRVLKSELVIPPLETVLVNRPRNYGPIALRLGVLVLIVLIAYKGVGALLYPAGRVDPVDKAQIAKSVKREPHFAAHRYVR